MPQLEVAFLTQAGALLKLIVLSILLERGLAFVFEHDWFARLVRAPRTPAPDLKPRFRGLKGLIAIGASLLICLSFKFDILGIFFDAPPSLLGEVVTAFVAAGGSAGAIRVFQGFLGFSKEVRDREVEARKIEAETAKQVALANAERAKAESETARLVTQAALRQARVRARGTSGAEKCPVDRSRIAVRLATTSEDPAALGTAFDLTLTRPEPWESHYIYRSSVTTPEAYENLLERLRTDRRIVRVSPVYGDGGSGYAFATDRMIFSLWTRGSVPTSVKDALAKGSASILSETSDRCLVLVGPSCDPIEFAGVIALLPEVASAEADLVHIGGSYGTYSPSLCEDADPEAAAGAYRLARVKEAWDILEGRELHDVLVAILDDGVDAAHPDLASIQLPHFDSFAGELASFPLSHDHHGTCCAGLVVAQPITDGMKGVGCGARLLPIRVNHRVTASSDIITSSWRLILGIDEAVAQGADVLSLSWSAEVCDTIQASIEAAATAGRNRRGCVIVAAAGNDGGSVRFPASLDCVIAVAGCDENGLLIRRGQVTSNYGPEVDVTAPALPMFTTIPGNGYTGCFGGTSAATALVAGAAALVLQVNPELTAKEVRDLLVATSTTQQDVVNGRVALLKVLNVEAAVNAIIVREPRQ